MVESTISLQKAGGLVQDRQVKEIFITLTTKSIDGYTNIRIGEDKSSSVDNPPVKIEVRNSESTRFHNLTEWTGNLEDNPKITFTDEDSFLRITCLYGKSKELMRYEEDQIYMINVNDVAYVSIKY
jgi:hypothetical protein